MLYGEEIHLIDSAMDDSARNTANALEAATGAIRPLQTMLEPGSVLYFGYVPTVAFDYDTQTAEGVLTLYKYPAGVAGSKIALATIPLVDDAVASTVYQVLVNDVPPNVVPTVRAYSDFEAGDTLAVWITTQAAGGGAIAGDFHAFIKIQRRGENYDNQDNLVDLSAYNTI